MGGERETVIAPPAAVKGGETVTASNIRIHEDAGCVHLHDDAAKLRVAIPSDVFHLRFTKWQEKILDDLIFLDDEAETIATFSGLIRKGTLKITIDVAKLKFDDGYKQLLKFVSGR